MTSEDDSFLSAYLDGQLDPEEHQWVESALALDPQLVEQLRALTVVRNLVGVLARGQSVDLTAKVMAQIQGLRPSPQRKAAWLFWPRSSVGRFAGIGVLATAAGVSLAISLAISQGPPLGLRGGAANRAHDEGIAVAKLSAPRTTARASADKPRDRTSSSHTVGSDANAGGAHGEFGSLADADAVVESSSSAPTGDLKHVLQFLDNPNLRRFVLVRGGKNGDGEQLVASVVERTTRYGFFKFTVRRGIKIDPRHPEEATVFAVIVNPAELNLLRDQLKVAVPDISEETSVDREIVTRLAGIGQAEPLHPTALADVSIPRADHALRTNVGNAAESAGPPEQTTRLTTRDRPTIEQERSAPVPARGSRTEPVSVTVHSASTAVVAAGGPAGSRKVDPIQHGPASRDTHDLANATAIVGRASAADKEIVVLVWVSKPSR
jgi:hypothetical protein